MVDKKHKISGYSAMIHMTVDVSVENKHIPSIYLLVSTFSDEAIDINIYHFQGYVSDEKRKMNYEALFEKALEDGLD